MAKKKATNPESLPVPQSLVEKTNRSEHAYETRVAARNKPKKTDSEYAYENGLVVARTDTGTPLLVAITGMQGEGKGTHWKGVVVAEGDDTWDELRRRTRT